MIKVIVYQLFSVAKIMKSTGGVEVINEVCMVYDATKSGFKDNMWAS